MIPEWITQEVEGLRGEGLSVDILEAEGWYNVIFHEHPVPARFNKGQTELLVKLPPAYPNGRPDMFWTDPDLTLQDGGVPKSADLIEQPLGRPWRRFSWHPSNWNPGTDDLRTYLEFINHRLAIAE